MSFGSEIANEATKGLFSLMLIAVGVGIFIGVALACWWIFDVALACWRIL